jgi:hypothetical protein
MLKVVGTCNRILFSYMDVDKNGKINKEYPILQVTKSNLIQ